MTFYKLTKPKLINFLLKIIPLSITFKHHHSYLQRGLNITGSLRSDSSLSLAVHE